MTEQKEIQDKAHREMMSEFVKDKKKEGYEAETEVPYNFYGRSGFIDVILKERNKLFVCELKPRLFNVGEAIRQVKQAQEFFLRARPEYSKFQEVHYFLIIKANEENLQVCAENKEMMKEIPIMFWETDKDNQERTNREYIEILQGKSTGRNRTEVRKLCLVCHKPITHRTNGNFCHDCWMMMR